MDPPRALTVLDRYKMHEWLVGRGGSRTLFRGISTPSRVVGCLAPAGLLFEPFGGGEQLRGSHVECGGELLDRLQSWVELATLEAADVIAVQLAELPEPFL